MLVGSKLPSAADHPGVWERTLFLGPNEPVTMSELLEDGPKLLVFYLFDWSST